MPPRSEPACGSVPQKDLASEKFVFDRATLEQELDNFGGQPADPVIVHEDPDAVMLLKGLPVLVELPQSPGPTPAISDAVLSQEDLVETRVADPRPGRELIRVGKLWQLSWCSHEAVVKFVSITT